MYLSVMQSSAAQVAQITADNLRSAAEEAQRIFIS